MNTKLSILLPLFCLALVPACGDSGPGGDPTLEQAAFEHVNDFRAEQGLDALEWSDVIAEQCRQHSANMAAGDVDFGHDGFEARVDAIGQSITFTYASENVATNQGYEDPALQAFESWQGSPPHLANMLGDHDLSGMGVAKSDSGGYFFTQIFIQLPASQ